MAGASPYLYIHGFRVFGLLWRKTKMHPTKIECKNTAFI